MLKKNFSKENELLFLQSKDLSDPLYIRGMFMMFIMFYGAFYFVDLHYFPEKITTLVLIRFFIVIPVLCLTVILTFTKYFYKLHQYLIALGFLVGGVGIAYMLILEPENVVYSGGLFIVIFSGYLLIKLRFIYATFSGIGIILFYIIGYLIVFNEMTSTLLYSSVFFVTANVIGIVGSYHIEKTSRQQFLNTREIIDINQLLMKQYEEKKEQFKILEKSIDENTYLHQINLEKDKLTQSLKESELKFRKLFEFAPFGYQSLDASGHFIEVNQKWLDIFGYQKDEVIGKWFGDFIDPNMKEAFKSRFEIFKQNGTTHTEFPMKTKQGDLIDVSFDGNISYDENHIMIQTHCTVGDMTEVNLANMKLRKSEEQYRLLTTQMQLGLALHEIICDDERKPVDYKFIHVNDSFEKLTGLKRESIMNKTILEVLPHTETYWIETYGDVALTGKSIQFENYAAEIGRYFNASAYSPKKGQFAVIVEDITERKLIELERKKEQKDLLTSQKIARLGTWRLDIKTNEVIWSEELYKMYGFDPKLAPPPYTEHMKLFTKPSWEKLSTSLALTSSNGIPYELELETVNLDGSNGWMWARGEAEYDDQGNIVSLSGAAQDITERKRLEQELSHTNQIMNTILDKSPVAIEFFDVNGNHTYSNDSALELFGIIDPNDLKSLNLFTNPNLSKDLLSNIQKAKIVQKEIEYDFDKINGNYHYSTKKSGKMILELSITPLVTNEKLNGYIVHSKDITEQKAKANEIIHISNHDFLTNMPNRRYFSENLEKLDLKNNYPLGIIMLDINGLKIINDSFGYGNGDKVIQHVAKVLMESVKENGVVARLGGDEFGMIVPCTTDDELTMLQEKMTEQVSNFSIHDVNVSLASGHALKFSKEESIDEIIKNAEQNMFKTKVLEGRSMRSAAIHTILATLTSKYDVEKIHSEKVSEYCYEMGKVMNLSKEAIEELKLAGLLHDIGKISIPDYILNKPGKLDVNEWDIMKKHTIYGYNILRAADEYSNLALYALTHHEKYDGSGYPKGLSKDEIPLFSRIISVIDAFEAMTADRPYRKAPGIEFAIKELIKFKNSQFDPEIVDTFLSKVLQYESKESV